jgi:hypothetical protein
MSYLSLLIALFMTRNVPEQMGWLDVYLNNLVIVEEWFYKASWWIWGAVIAVTVIFGILALVSRKFEASDLGFLSGGMSIGCGCLSIFMLGLPLFEWLTLLLANNMASAVGPSGIVDQGKFWINLIIYILIGSG